MKLAEKLLRCSYLPVVGSIFKSDIIPRENCFIVKVDVDVSKITKYLFELQETGAIA